MPYLKLVAPSILVLIAAVHSTAAGQSIPSPYTFIEHGQAWAIFAGKSNLNPGQLGLGPQDGNTLGGRYAVAFGSVLNLDVDGTLFRLKRDVLDVSQPEDDRFLGKTDFSVALVDLRLRINLTGQRAWRRLQPFVLFGGGLTFAQSTDRLLELATDMPRNEWYDFGTRFAGTFGGGTSFHVSDKISLRLDGVVNLWKIATPVGWLTVDNDPGGDNTEGEWVSAKTIRLGAAWRL
jgi:opacity protein-like surface antigen